ncbi:kinase-like protein, partial [Coprinopsis marcescibilis]
KPKYFALKAQLRAEDGKHGETHLMEAVAHHRVANHPNILDLEYVFQDKVNTYFVMEYAPHGSLYQQIFQKHRYVGKDEAIKSVFGQLLGAVTYMHRKGVYHRDLKPQNILCFDEGDRVAICDFGLATSRRVCTEFGSGTKEYMTPESLVKMGRDHSKPYSPAASDVWALAHILLNLVTGRRIWTKASRSNTAYRNYLKAPYTFFLAAHPISAALNELLVQALDPNPTARLSLKEFTMKFEAIETF